jgi:hypothetical protein
MDKLTKIKVAGVPEGFQELSFTTDGVTLNYVLGPDHGLPLGINVSFQSFRRDSMFLFPISEGTENQPGLRDNICTIFVVTILSVSFRK